MAIQLQLRRGTTQENDAFMGAEGEVTFDTQEKQLRVHDGLTVGGVIVRGTASQNLFDWKWADHKLNDVQWLRGDTFSWQKGSIYQAAYAHLVSDINGKTLRSETIGSTTIQFYLADDGHKICPVSQADKVEAIYAATGVAWYYIIDTTNTRFKLPRTQFGFTGIRNSVGEYVKPGIPNITVSFGEGISTNGGIVISGNAADKNGSTFATAANTSTTGERLAGIDASLASSVYNESTTVQPPATQMYLYFYVGEFNNHAIENTAGIVTEDLNDKVDVGHEVVAFQAPTAENNHTWYRKYRDGWVEQGGRVTVNGVVSSSNKNVQFPIRMATHKYIASVDQNASVGMLIEIGWEEYDGMSIGTLSAGSTGETTWRVEGMAAQ